MSRKKRRANPSMNNPVLIGSVGRQLVTRNGAAPYLHTTNDASLQTEFILLHVFTKNLQSIRDECRFQDFFAELDICDFDICLFCETWRVERQDCIVTRSGCRIFLAGGDERKGVGIAVSNRLMQQISEVTFHAYSSRICLLQFAVGNSKFSFISCYFPTSWDDDGEIEVMYELLQLIVASARNAGSKIVVADGHVTVQQVWHDYIVPIGLDHRCVHCILQWPGARPPPKHRRINLKNWAPKLDEHGTASSFCNCLTEQLTRIQEVSCQSLEKCLVQGGKLHGTYGSKRLVFKPSEDLLRLRWRRRTAFDLAERKQLSFQIRKLHRQEVRTWRSASLRLCLNNSSSWNLMRGMLQPTGRHVVEQPHPNDFADMLENIFAGNFDKPMDRPMLTEAPWSMNELRAAIRRAKNKRTGDDLGLVAELLKYAPEGYLEALLDVFRHALSTGEIPTSWQTTIFKMLPKSRCAKFASDFRPIASLRLLYKIFAYLMLGRMEKTLENSQPEEQHGFRKQRRIEEHLLTANLCLQKTLAANIPLWIISLDLSKAFDKVNWEALWAALMQHGVSQHLVWILQCI